MSAPLLVVHVHVHVKAEFVDAFVAATLENARASMDEPGIARFDITQSNDDPTRFVFVEAYKTADAPDAHKRTALREVARYGRGHAGGAPQQHEVPQLFSGE